MCNQKLTSFPYGYVTKEEFEKIEWKVIMPNELKAMVDYYVEKERQSYKKIIDSYFNFKYWFNGKGNIAYCRYKFADVEYIMIDAGLKKDYDFFFSLSKAEVDDMMTYYKAYGAASIARKVRDFYNAESEDNIVCYVNHQQKRDLNWLVKNQPLVKSLLQAYRNSDMFKKWENEHTTTY